MTEFFKIFPFFASDYFYITIIAFTYWMGSIRAKRLALELIYLVAFSTIICVLLKEFFCIFRPDIATHLVRVHDPYGFPSGDVEVATVFWGMIAARNRIWFLRAIALILVILIAISRVYLGVHSIIDVTGGFVFGIVTIILWNNKITQKVVDDWMIQKMLGFWGLFFLGLSLCIISGINITIYPMIIISYGALLALGLSLDTGMPIVFVQRINLGLCICAFISTIALVRFIPISHTNTLFMAISGSLKYFAITAWITLVIPKIYLKISQNLSRV